MIHKSKEQADREKFMKEHEGHEQMHAEMLFIMFSYIIIITKLNNEIVSDIEKQEIEVASGVRVRRLKGYRGQKPRRARVHRRRHC